MSTQPALTQPARLAALHRTALGPGADPALDRFAGMVCRVLGVKVALVSLVDDHRQFFPGQAGLPEPWAELRETPLTHSFCQHVVATGTPLVVEDARTDPLVAASLAIPDLSVVAYAGMPLTDVSGHVLGSLCAIGDEPRAWTHEQLDLLADLAAACSSELRLRIAAHSAQAALSRVAMLSEVTRAVATTLDADDALARLTRLVVPVLGDWCTAGLVDEAGRVRLAIGKHRDPAKAASLTRFTTLQSEVLDAGAPTRVVLRTGEGAVLGPDEVGRLLGAVHADRALLDDLEPESVLVVPLRARGGALGYLTLGRGGSQPAYGEAELHDALDIGRRTGLALDNAELFRQQRHNAETLQRNLLTRLPEPDHLHVVARYVPAADSAQVGGDWYDAFLQPDGATMLVVGDVMGHDITSAAMMGQVRNLVRGIAYDRDDAPAALLSRIDGALRGLHVDTLATVILARIEQTGPDARRGLRRLRWSNAGHPPPVHIAADGTVRVLDTPCDLLLGIDADTDRHDHELVLEPGSSVLLYTDGLLERRDRGLDQGLARLRRSLAGLAAEPLDVLCDQLLLRMLPQRSEDDVALVAVRAYPEDGPRPGEAGPEDVPAG